MRSQYDTLLFEMSYTAYCFTELKGSVRIYDINLAE